MDTSAISQRVADFLKKHPPFQAVDDADVLALAAVGRVRFYEANEYILWQGHRHKMEVLVIQQGTVSLWDESRAHLELRDVRGAGDMLAVEQFHDEGMNRFSARASSDVVIYAFPAIEFEALILKYPYASDYVAAYSGVSGAQQGTAERDAPHAIYLHDLVRDVTTPVCAPEDTIRDVAGRLVSSGADAMAVVDAERRPRGVITRDRLLAWVARGSGTGTEAIETIMGTDLRVVQPDTSVAEGVLRMALADDQAMAVTDAGTAAGHLQALITAPDLAQAFGEQPIALLAAIRRAKTPRELAALNARARSFVLEYLTSAAAVDWLTRFTHAVDRAIIKQAVAMHATDLEGCWCVTGAAGRAEQLTRLSPEALLILPDTGDHARGLAHYGQAMDTLGECGYLPRPDASFDRAFHVASTTEWKNRFANWIREPVLQEMYRARSLFDLRPIDGPAAPFDELRSTVSATVDREFLFILANDCLANLPPLTFFENAVVDTTGEQTGIFRLEHSVLLPLVDVGRVFGMAARAVLGTSTRERLQTARTILPTHEAVFREAADTLSIVLWQQGRVGNAQGTSGSELPPSLLSRSDRNALKSGFRSILRLLELTADPSWLDSL